MQELDKRTLIKNSIRDHLPLPHTKFLKSLALTGFQPKVIYDIGSSLMHWAREAQEAFPDAKIICFDGMAELYFLYAGTKFDFYTAVLSNEEKVVRWYQNDKSPGGNSYYRETGGFFPRDSYKEKLTTTLDKLVERLGLPLPDLIKMDVQGAEQDIIRGAPKCIEHCQRLIVEMQKVMYNEGAPLVTETKPFIESLGFTCDAPLFCDNGPDGDYSFVKTSACEYAG